MAFDNPLAKFDNPLARQENRLETRPKKYKSGFDYESVGIKEEHIEELEELSEKINKSVMTISEKRLVLMEALEKAYLFFPKDGSFGNWCEASGMSRQDVSVINKMITFAEKNDIPKEKVAELPEKLILEGTKKKTELTQEEIKEIAYSEHPYFELRKKKEEIKNKNLSGAPDKSILTINSTESGKVRNIIFTEKEYRLVYEILKKELSLDDPLLLKFEK